MTPESDSDLLKHHMYMYDAHYVKGIATMGATREEGGIFSETYHYVYHTR